MDIEGLVVSPAERRRVHPGVTAGGQFTVTSRQESGAVLGGDGLPEGSYSALTAEELAGALPGGTVVFHVAPRARLAAIREQGMRAGSDHRDWDDLAPRTDCLYFGKKDFLDDGWLHEWTHHLAGRDLVLSVDLADVDLRRILPDEDTYGLSEQAPAPDGVPAWPEREGQGQGEWADEHHLGERPGETATAIAARGTLAIRGPIPPELVTVYRRDGYRYVPLGTLAEHPGDDDELLAAIAAGDDDLGDY